MESRKIVGVKNAVALHQSGMTLLERAREITTHSGKNEHSLAEIGTLLREMSASGMLDELLAMRPGGKPAAVDVIAEHTDGSLLSLYAMQDWQSPPSNDVHWHNYWQILLVIEGSWPDTVWRPVVDTGDRIAGGVVVDRREVFSEGALQTLGPKEPHGWIASEIRATDKATLLMWSCSAEGQPRVVLDPDTGRLTDEYGFLNPEPGAELLTGREQQPAGGSKYSWVRF